MLIFNSVDGGTIAATCLPTMAFGASIVKRECVSALSFRLTLDGWRDINAVLERWPVPVQIICGLPV